MGLSAYHDYINSCLGNQMGNGLQSIANQQYLTSRGYIQNVNDHKTSDNEQNNLNDEKLLLLIEE